MDGDRVRRAERAIRDAGERSRTVVELCRSVHDAIAPIVPSDRWCGFAIDPAALLATNGFHDQGIPFEHVPRLLELEHGDDDPNQIRQLANTRSGVATLQAATHGDPAASARWREVLQPAGLPHELRAVARDGGRAWGSLILLRAADSAPFTEADTDVMARLTHEVAIGFRRVLVRQQIDHADDARDAGIVVVGGDPAEVVSATHAAREWLDRLDDGGHGGPLPTAVLSALYEARASATGPGIVRARTRTGRWVTITAERLVDGGAGQFGVVVQPSRPAEIATILAAAHRLTPRETDVVLLVAAGHSNRQIAAALGVSPHTVGDHLKNVFGKLDVASRGEMISKLFHDHYLPRELGGSPVGADGWFLPG